MKRTEIRQQFISYVEHRKLIAKRQKRNMVIAILLSVIIGCIIGRYFR